MFAGSQCFPTLVLYIACCPPSDVVPLEDLQLTCPKEYLDRLGEDCCGAPRDRADFVFRVLNAVAASKLSADSEERAYVIAGIERVLMDFDHTLESAWRMLAITTAASACMEADSLKDDFKRAADTLQPMAQITRELLPRAKQTSRHLAKAAVRLEAFAAYLLAKLAVNTGRSFPEVDPEEVTDHFDEVLMSYYKMTVREHDELAYNTIPPLQEATVQRVVKVNASDVINMVVLNLG
ncbi:unnamed protein product, partial [Effrenium voratum]